MASYLMTLLITKANDVSDLLLNEIGRRLSHGRNEMKKLVQTLYILESLLEDAELKQLGDDEVCNFLGKVKYLVYVSEDVLDDWLIHIKLKNLSKVCSYSSSSTSLVPAIANALNCVFTFNKSKKIRSLRLKLEKMTVESLKYFLIKTVPKDLGKHNYYFGYGNFGENDVVCGRELDKEIIMKKLFEKYSGVKVVSIFGMAGIGKTTLARAVYNHDEVKSHFDARIWVSVPQSASYLKMTLVRILEGLSSSPGDDFTCGSNFNGADHIDCLMSLLNSRIQKKKFLLVLDDVWDENIKKWQSLKNSLTNGVQGSCILILTHNKMASYLMSTTTLHELKPLSEESAWELFRRNAFAKQDVGVDALKPFEDIGRIVSKRCNGVPLALKCLGRLLRTKTTAQEWEDIMESDKWELLEMEPILPALYFSYYSLPPVLKLCLSYTAIFPKACEIEKGMLIKLWMAQGFLGSFTKEKDPEFVGEECFRELMMLSYFNPHRMDKDGVVTCIKMHDLVHELAASMSGQSVLEIGNTPVRKNKARHLSVLYTDLDSVARSVRKENHVSTLKLIECRVISGTVSPHLFAHLKYLRVLDLSFVCLAELPNQVRKLKHLRYLNLSHTNLQSLSEKICSLHNLQTLTLSGCEQLTKLPENLGNLRGLRHLELKNTPKLQYFPEGFGKLTDLRTLSKFVIASSSTRGAKIGELKELNLLQGHLEIRGLNRVKSGSDAMEADLVKKKHLQSLCLNFEFDLEQNPEAIKIMENVLEALKPFPELLNNVEVRNYLSSKYPSWMSPPHSDQTEKNTDVVQTVVLRHELAR